MRLKRATYRHIEAEIYAYHETVRVIEEFRREIIFAGRQEVDNLWFSGGNKIDQKRKGAHQVLFHG